MKTQLIVTDKTGKLKKIIRNWLISQNIQLETFNVNNLREQKKGMTITIEYETKQVAE